MEQRHHKSDLALDGSICLVSTSLKVTCIDTTITALPVYDHSEVLLFMVDSPVEGRRAI